MQLIRIVDKNSKDFEAAYDIYKNSFPIFEQRILSDQLEALSDEDYFCHIVKDNDGTVLGLLFTWRTASFIYVEHLAILESKRGDGLGSKILKDLQASSHLPIILEIDPPIDDISIRRRGFYERLGFIMHDFHHMHPAFTKESGIYELKVMATPRINQDLYNEFREYMFNRIMYYSYSRIQS